MTIVSYQFSFTNVRRIYNTACTQFFKTSVSLFVILSSYVDSHIQIYFLETLVPITITSTGNKGPLSPSPS